MHLDLDAVRGRRLRRVQAGAHHRAVRHERDVAPGPDQPRLEQRVGRGRRVELGLLPVAALGLEEHDRVVARDRLLDHPVPVDRVRRRDDAQPGGVREVRLRALAVVLDRADAAAVRDADDQRASSGRRASARAAWPPATRSGRTPGRRSRRTGSRPPAGSRASPGPTAVPTMPLSASGESMTRSSPKSFCSPSVTRKTPPSLPMSSPISTTRSSSSSARRSPRLSARASVTVSVTGGLRAGRARVLRPRTSPGTPRSSALLLVRRAGAARRTPGRACVAAPGRAASGSRRAAGPRASRPPPRRRRRTPGRPAAGVHRNDRSRSIGSLSRQASRSLASR